MLFIFLSWPLNDIIKMTDSFGWRRKVTPVKTNLIRFGNRGWCIKQGEVAGDVNEEDLEGGWGGIQTRAWVWVWGGDSELRFRQIPPPTTTPSPNPICATLLLIVLMKIINTFPVC